MNDPTTPSAIVPTIPIGSRPGTTARAMKPAIAPIMISEMIKPITVTPFGPHRSSKAADLVVARLTPATQDICLPPGLNAPGRAGGVVGWAEGEGSTVSAPRLTVTSLVRSEDRDGGGDGGRNDPQESGHP